MAVFSDVDGNKNSDIPFIDNMKEGWFHGMVKHAFGSVPRHSVASQMGIGVVTGMVSGWLFGKAGRTAAASVGTTVLLIQLAHHQGYIKINWDRVMSSVRLAENEITRTAQTQYPTLFLKCKDFIQSNVFLAVGFGGGFLIGLAI